MYRKKVIINKYTSVWRVKKKEIQWYTRFLYKNIKTKRSFRMFLVFSVLSLKMFLTYYYFPNEKILSRCAYLRAVSYTHLRAHETPEHLVCRLLLEKKKHIHFVEKNQQKNRKNKKSIKKSRKSTKSKKSKKSRTPFFKCFTLRW